MQTLAAENDILPIFTTKKNAFKFRTVVAQASSFAMRIIRTTVSLVWAEQPFGFIAPRLLICRRRGFSSAICQARHSLMLPYSRHKNDFHHTEKRKFCEMLDP